MAASNVKQLLPNGGELVNRLTIVAGVEAHQRVADPHAVFSCESRIVAGRRSEIVHRMQAVHILDEVFDGLSVLLAQLAIFGPKKGHGDVRVVKGEQMIFDVWTQSIGYRNPSFSYRDSLKLEAIEKRACIDQIEHGSARTS